MGNSTSINESVTILDHPERKVFVRYQSMNTVSGSLFGSYIEFHFKISYYRWFFNVSIRYNDLLRFEQRIFKKYPNELASVDHLSKHTKFFHQHDQPFLDHRSRVMTKFLQQIFDSLPDPFSENIIYKFFQISITAFQPEYGRKGKEGYLKKSSGGYIEKFSNKIGDYVRVWKWRWIVLHDNCIIWYKNPDCEEMLGCLQIDQDFGVAQAGRVISLKTGTRRLTFFAQNIKTAQEWVTELQKFYTPKVTKHFFEATFPPRMNNEVRVYTNGCEYFQAVAVALLQAQKEILIASWKNSPTVLLTRPPLPPLRLDQILKYKADQGVNIFVLLYKEVEHIGQGNDSFNVKKKLEGLSPNIHVIRHPNKFMGGSTAVLWSHHEKLVIVDRNMAFVGGIDLAFQRWDDEHHRVADEDGMIFPGNDYRQPAPALFRPVRNIDSEIEENDSDEEMIEILVARPGESLPQATTALVDDDDQPIEVDVVVDFGMCNAPTSTPGVQTAQSPQQNRSVKFENSIGPAAKSEQKEDDSVSNDSNIPGGSETVEDATPEELEALRKTQVTESGGRSSVSSSILHRSFAGTKSSMTYLSDAVVSYASQAKALTEQYITSQKLKKSSYWETRDVYPRMGWHDVHAGISGRAARDVASHFVQRWNHHRLSTNAHNKPILRDITDDLNFAVCAKCELEGIYETAQSCPTCHYDLGPINSYSSPPSTAYLPSPVNRYSFMLFECRYSKSSKLPFRLHGDCPSVVTSIISSLSASQVLNDDAEGVIIDVGGPMSEWLAAFGLYPAVGDIIASVDGQPVTHLNSNQIKRLIKRIKKGLASSCNTTNEYFTISFRRHYLENLHPVDKMEESQVRHEEPVVEGSATASPIGTPSANAVVAEPIADKETVENSNGVISESTVAGEAGINSVMENGTTQSPSSSAADYHPICQAAAQMEISYSMSKLFHEFSKFCDSVPRICNDQGSCKVQVLRSIGKWSIGTKTECSILNCYIETIRDSLRFIYIENQFFIGSLAGDGTQNKIAEALVERILRAHSRREPFRVIIIIPLHPNGDFVSAMKSKVVMHYEYQTINRCQTSLLSQLKAKAPGISIGDYIGFYSLRNWGVINNKIVSDQIYVHDKVMIVDDRIMIIGSANINDRSMLGFRDSEIALRIEDTFHIDSIMNGQPHTVGYLPFTIRVKLMRQHLGNPSIDLTDPLNPQVVQFWRATAANNSTAYDELDGQLSYYRCIGSILYKNALDQFTNKSYLDTEARRCVEQIKGFLVDWPQNFFSGEDLSPSLATRALIPNEMWL